MLPCRGAPMTPSCVNSRPICTTGRRLPCTRIGDQRAHLHTCTCQADASPFRMATEAQVATVSRSVCIRRRERRATCARVRLSASRWRHASACCPSRHCGRVWAACGALGLTRTSARMTHRK
jgi:hypothetical protein